GGNVPLGCYVVRGVTGHFFAVGADQFAEVYEPAPGPPVLPADEFETVRALRDGARMLAKVVVGHSRAMEAARIELAQGSAEKAMQWILNSLPDVWDDPETEWDGKESANEWWDRTDSFYRAAETAPAPPGDADPS